MKVKNIKSNILLIILSIHVYVLKTHGDTKMTTCCCGSCREDRNQENTSTIRNPKDILSTKNKNKESMTNENKHILNNLIDNIEVKNNDIIVDNEVKTEESITKEIIEKNNISTDLNTNKQNINNSNVLTKKNNSTNSYNSIKEGNNTFYKNNNNNTNNYSSSFISSSISNNDSNNLENNTYNNNNNNNNNIKLIKELNDNLSIYNNDKKEMMKKNEEILNKKNALLDMQIKEETKKQNDEDIKNKLSLYIMNGEGLDSKNNGIYNSYKSENKKNETNITSIDDIVKVIKSLIEFFNEKYEKLKSLSPEFTKGTNKLHENYKKINKNTEEHLKSKFRAEYENIFVDKNNDNTRNINEYEKKLELIKNLERINKIDHNKINDIYKGFSALEVYYKVVSEELKLLEEKIVEIDYQNKAKNLGEYLKSKNIEIETGKIKLFKIIKNKISLEYGRNYCSKEHTSKATETKGDLYLAITNIKDSKYCKFNIVSYNNNKYENCSKSYLTNTITDESLGLPVYQQSAISKLKCKIYKDFTIYKKEETKKQKNTHSRYKSTLTNDTSRKTFEVNEHSSSLIIKQTNKIVTTDEKNNKINTVKKTSITNKNEDDKQNIKSGNINNKTKLKNIINLTKANNYSQIPVKKESKTDMKNDTTNGINNNKQNLKQNLDPKTKTTKNKNQNKNQNQNKK